MICCSLFEFFMLLSLKVLTLGARREAVCRTGWNLKSEERRKGAEKKEIKYNIMRHGEPNHLYS